MIFQVIKNGEVKFWTDIESCVPSEEHIKDLKKAGYKIKIIKDKKQRK